MPDQDFDLGDAEEWSRNFRAKLNDIGVVSPEAMAFARWRYPVDGLLGSNKALDAASRPVATRNMPGGPVGSNGPDSSNVTQVDPVTVTGRASHVVGLAGNLADIAGKIWASPWTALGLALGGGEYAAGLLTGTHPNVTVGNNAVQFTGLPDVLHTVLPGVFDKNLVGTLGNVQLYTGQAMPGGQGHKYLKDGLPAELGPHEEAHTYQYQALGPFFPAAWLGYGGLSDDNPLEKSADAYAEGKGGPFSLMNPPRPPMPGKIPY